MTGNHILNVFSLALVISHLRGNVVSENDPVMNISTMIPCPEYPLKYCSDTQERPLIHTLYSKSFKLASNCAAACYCQAAGLEELYKNTAFQRHPQPNCILSNTCNFRCSYKSPCGYIIWLSYSCTRNQGNTEEKDSVTEASEMDEIGNVYILIALFSIFTLLVVAITASLLYFHKKRKSLVELASVHREGTRNIYTTVGTPGISRRASAPEPRRDNTEWMSIREVQTLRLAMNSTSMRPPLSEDLYQNTQPERQSEHQGGTEPPVTVMDPSQANHLKTPEYVNTMEAPKCATTKETPEYLNTQKTPKCDIKTKEGDKYVNNQTTLEDSKTPIITQCTNTQGNPEYINIQECKPLEETTYINGQLPSYENFPTNVGSIQTCQDDAIDEVDGTLKSMPLPQSHDDYCSDDSDAFETLPNDHVRRYLRNLPKDNVPCREESGMAAVGPSVHLQRFVEQCVNEK